jgi:hypothetical protein
MPVITRTQSKSNGIIIPYVDLTLDPSRFNAWGQPVKSKKTKTSNSVQEEEITHTFTIKHTFATPTVTTPTVTTHTHTVTTPTVTTPTVTTLINELLSTRNLFNKYLH